MYTTVKFIKMEGTRTITRDTDIDFFFELQLGVLLSLKEDGKLTEMQYRYAENTLNDQRMTIMRTKNRRRN